MTGKIKANQGKKEEKPGSWDWDSLDLSWDWDDLNLLVSWDWDDFDLDLSWDWGDFTRWSGKTGTEEDKRGDDVT